MLQYSCNHMCQLFHRCFGDGPIFNHFDSSKIWRLLLAKLFSSSQDKAHRYGQVYCVWAPYHFIFIYFLPWFFSVQAFVLALCMCRYLLPPPPHLYLSLTHIYPPISHTISQLARFFSFSCSCSCPYLQVVFVIGWNNRWKRGRREGGITVKIMLNRSLEWRPNCSTLHQ